MNQVLGFVVVWSLVSILGIEGVLIETTTLPALPPCKCLGDADLLAVPENAKKVLKTCLQAKSRLTADALGYIAEKYRCGSRTPSLPTMDPDSVCYCKNQTEQVPIENAYLVEYTLINENAAHRWEFYKYQATKRLELNRMDEPESPQFINLKQRVEEMFNNAFVTEASAVAQQFVRAAVMRFQKKIGCMGCPATTTTTTTTTTAASTSAGAPAAVTAAAPAETAAPAARKKRAATAPPATTIPINYDSYYITVFMEVQFMKPVADFQSMFTTVLPTVEEFGTSAVPANVTFPAPGVCKNINLTELLPSTMPSMTHDKQIILVNKTKRFPNDTEILDANGSPQVMMFNATTPESEDRNFLKPGQAVNMWCKNPAQKPSRDIFDLDPYDGKVTAVCQPDGVYSLRVTQLAPCIFVCYQTDIPLPGLETGLVLIGITPAGSARMRPISSVDPDEYIWAWDRLVYGCRIPNYGIEGGSDTVLDRYQCTNTSTYNAPNPKDPGSTGAWPKCRPQSYMVVDAAIKMLARYDERVENRYKLILFKELDGEDNITFNDHLISVTLPTVIVMVMIILVALFCSRNNSPICSICASKESAYED